MTKSWKLVEICVKVQVSHLDGLVILVGLSLGAEGLDDGVVGVDLQVLLGGHVTKLDFRVSIQVFLSKISFTYPMVEVSLRAWAFMIRSMLADQPYWEVTIQHGEETIRLETTTFSTFLSRMF